MAFFVGLFMAFMPIPGQMIAAALLAILLGCNLPLAVSLCWITNPLTMPAIFFLAYKTGAMLVDVPVQDVEFELSFHWLTNTLTTILKPFLLARLLCALFYGSFGYFVLSALWPWPVAQYWRLRRGPPSARKFR